MLLKSLLSDSEAGFGVDDADLGRQRQLTDKRHQKRLQNTGERNLSGRCMGNQEGMYKDLAELLDLLLGLHHGVLTGPVRADSARVGDDSCQAGGQILPAPLLPRKNIRDPPFVLLL